jgi:hypothetical protein
MDSCTFTHGEPCCMTRDIANEIWWNLSWQEKIQKQKNLACPVHNYGIEHEGKNACFFPDRDITCPEESKGLCMYDRNEVPCCTEKFELFQSWQKEGYVEGLGPYDALIGHIEDPKGWMKYIYEHQIRMEPKYVYSVRRDYGKSKWNFVCPTHHPVPTVAILLGLFIPITVILTIIIGITWYRGKQTAPKKAVEEEAGVDEKPPAKCAAIEESHPVVGEEETTVPDPERPVEPADVRFSTSSIV